MRLGLARKETILVKKDKKVKEEIGYFVDAGNRSLLQAIDRLIMLMMIYLLEGNN